MIFCVEIFLRNEQEFSKPLIAILFFTIIVSTFHVFTIYFTNNCLINEIKVQNFLACHKTHVVRTFTVFIFANCHQT